MATTINRISIVQNSQLGIGIMNATWVFKMGKKKRKRLFLITNKHKLLLPFKSSYFSPFSNHILISICSKCLYYQVIAWIIIPCNYQWKKRQKKKQNSAGTLQHKSSWKNFFSSGSNDELTNLAIRFLKFSSILLTIQYSTPHFWCHFPLRNTISQGLFFSDILRASILHLSWPHFIILKCWF